ncbi:DNA primase [Paucilactobacillus hokkaidonensis]|nr:DNA primase [Paucilactobacillus hokkaidonensis]
MATMIPEEVIDQVRSGVNIADVIGQYVQLKKSGKNLFGLCPFHEEKTGSFSVNEGKQIFHCFSCGRGGNVFKFLMEIENISFPQAVIKVAEDAGITLPTEYQEVQATGTQNSTTQTLIDLHEQAAKLYHHILVNTQAGKQALNYLQKRGLSADIIDQFNIGFAPAQRLLSPFFKEKDIDYQMLRQSGLFIEDQEGKLRDRFVDRVMFPIKNSQGKIIAFSGRLLSTENTDMPKYLNSPETTIFNKRKVLFNFDIARKSARKEQKMILFEGFMDVIAAYRAGVINGIASMGTSLTEEQINMIERVTSHLDVCYDGDAAGQNAINRAVALIGTQSSRLELGVVAMPVGVDPDEYLQQNGPEKFQQWLKDAVETPVAFTLHFLRQDLNLDNEADQLKYLNSALRVIAKVQSPLEQDVYLNQLVSEFQLNKESLQAQMQQIVRQTATQQSKKQVTLQNDHREQAPVYQQHEVEPVDRINLAERMLLRQMLHDHDVWLHVQSVDNFSFIHEKYQTLYLLAASYFDTHDTYSSAEFIDYIGDEQLQRLLVDIELSQANDNMNLDAINDYLKLIMQKTPLEQQIKTKRGQLHEATHLKNQDLEQQLTIELMNLLKKQQQL